MDSDNDNWKVSIVKTSTRSEARNIPVATRILHNKKQSEIAKQTIDAIRKFTKGQSLPFKTVQFKRCESAKQIKDVIKTPSQWLPFNIAQSKITTIKEKHNANINAILTYSNATPIRTRLDTGYACSYCDASYPDPADLKKHCVEHSNHTELIKKVKTSKALLKFDITALRCNVCQETTDSLEILMQHLKDAHAKTVHLDVHTQIVPFKFCSDKLQCHICTSSFSNFKLLLQHMNKHFKNYVCELCGAGFLNQISFNNHKKMTHKTGAHKCRRCPKKFDTLQDKKLHERDEHRLDLRYKCGYCTEKFQSHRNKVAHLAEQHGCLPTTHKCNECGKEFEGKFLMNSHVRRVHMMEKSHACDSCDMSFFTKGELADHLVKHTGARQFKCDKCSKTFGRKKALRQHMRVHENDRRFKCDHCNQHFVQKRDWKRHMLSVHGEDI